MCRQRRSNRHSRFGISCAGQFTFGLPITVSFALTFALALTYPLAVTYALAELCDVEKRWRAHGPQLA